MSQDRRPEMGTVSGNEIYFGRTGNRAQFLLEILKLVPDGCWIDISGVDLSKLVGLRAYERYKNDGGWFKRPFIGIEINQTSLPLIEEALRHVDLRRDWADITICDNKNVYFDAHDFMEDSTTFVTYLVPVKKIDDFKKSGLIEAFEAFIPEK